LKEIASLHLSGLTPYSPGKPIEEIERVVEAGRRAD
jgi:hypothetical protein